jgi:hypothetical protein
VPKAGWGDSARSAGRDQDFEALRERLSRLGEPILRVNESLDCAASPDSDDQKKQMPLLKQQGHCDSRRGSAMLRD